MIRALFAACAALMLAAPAEAVEIQEITSPGGIEAWLVEDHSIPFVALELRFRGGASLDAPGKRGAINLMTATIEEGAGDLDAQGFAEAREALAATYRFSVGDDTLSVSARMLTENRDAAVDLLKLALTEPRFDTDAVERVRGQVLSGLQSDAQDPGTLAGRAFDALAFGAHPYATAPDGTLESVAALTREDILDAKARTIARNRVVVSAVGDITAEDLGLLLDNLLADLPETGAALPGEAEMGLTGGVTVVDFDTPQSVVVFGHEGLKRDDPDFFPAYILNQILGGGGFSSRLMQEVREARGLTYGVYSYIVPRDHAETWQGSFASSNDRVAEAIEVVRAEWVKAAEGGVTEAELEAAKTYLTGSYPLRFDGNGQIADILVGMQLDDLPADYVNTRNAEVEAVTLEDIARVAAERLQPEDLRFVVAGRPVALEASN
ncbi:pitrilysin family protein [Frigidibacter sp.]|uniref:M16 family metallopeptidase n=1 Tax=Frigidibacter sp. TaxID=2586418 RepID=UPI0027359F8D|nr:pitrilysin family protein [Frigidibacter sp.]MDP3341793.1 pitrilysin family protein [Frigidibacter sp.]